MIEKIVKENQLDATLSKVEDIVELLNYGIMTTPAIVVDGEVKLKGHVPTESEIKKILGI
jgi:small redox-active disulfide protein 2